MITDEYDDIQLHENISNGTCEVIQSGRSRLFMGETAYTDAFRFFSDLMMNKVYGFGKQLW